MVATARERLSVRKLAAQMFDIGDALSGSPTRRKSLISTCFESQNRFAALEKFDNTGDIKRPVKTFVITSKFSVTES
jgi:hypothetical protein